MSRVVLFATLAILVSGCDEETFIEPLPSVLEEGSLSFRTSVDNSTVPNGCEHNGRFFNGRFFNGRFFNGRFFNGVTLNGATTLTDLVYDSTDGTIAGLDDTSSSVSLEPSDELVFDGGYDDGQTVTTTQTKVSEIEQVTGGSHNYQFQRVKMRTLESSDPDVWSDWDDICLDGADQPTKAILLNGDWVHPTFDKSAPDPEEDELVTWACRGAALAKCVEWGYHPEGVVSSTSLADHHQACTRMVRADYCGNGHHHTENGTIIDVADSLGIQAHDSTWDIEAAWGPDGALCVNSPRKTYWTRTQALDACPSIPSCDANANSDLGDDVAYWYSQGAVLVTRNQPSALLVEPPANPDGSDPT